MEFFDILDEQGNKTGKTKERQKLAKKFIETEIGIKLFIYGL